MNIIEKLKSLNVEITPEIEKAFAGDFISQQEHEKKIGKIEAERDKYKADAESAGETLKGFEGKDFDQLSKDVEAWKKKAEDAEKEYAAQLSKRDYSDAIKALIDPLKFTSTSARKAFIADLEANPLQMRDGKVLGFDDYLKGYKESDAGAFVAEQAETRSQFTGSIQQQGSGSNGTDIAKMRAVMGLKTDK